MAVTLTNQVSSQASRGQVVLVTLNGTDALKLGTITLGQTATISSSSKVGKVSFIDTYGHYIKVSPLLQNATLNSSSTPGILNATETVTIT